MDVVRAELREDPTIDITTTGRHSGRRRRIEIWMLDVDGRFFITGTPGPRDWYANLRARPNLVVHLKRRARVDLDATAETVDDVATRRRVMEHVSARWYRTQSSLDDLVARAPMIEVTFAGEPTTRWQRPAISTCGGQPATGTR
jgi:deazaflavin-dependent oxidoreductase (nitroreductase family)